MARINVENKLFERGEWMQLLLATGSPDTALGALVRAWVVAQRYWFPDQKPIPQDVWAREKLNAAVIDSGLAEVRDGGVYVRGSAEQFAWLFEASAKGSKGGKASAEKRKKAAKPAKHRSTTGTPQVDLGQAQVNLGEASYSLLSSLTLNSSLPTQTPAQDGEAAEPAAQPVGNELVSEFYSCWRAKHGGKAPLLDKDHKRLKDLGKQLGVPQAKTLVSAYFKVSDPWFQTKMHDVETLMQNLPKVQAFVDRNQRRPNARNEAQAIRYDVEPPKPEGPSTLTFADILAMRKASGLGDKDQGAS